MISLDNFLVEPLEVSNLLDSVDSSHDYFLYFLCSSQDDSLFGFGSLSSKQPFSSSDVVPLHSLEMLLSNSQPFHDLSSLSLGHFSHVLSGNSSDDLSQFQVMEFDSSNDEISSMLV